MSSPFTTLTGSIDPYSATGTSLCNELRNAYSERRQVLGQSAQADLPVGTDIQLASFWSTMQTWCETYCTSFVNHDAPISGANFTNWTLAAWRNEAGIPSGFRRATTWPTDWTDYSDPAYTYGTALNTGTPRQIKGPWLIEDLQNAFSTLKWTASKRSASAANTDSAKYRSPADSEDIDCGTSRTEALALYAAATWDTIATPGYYYNCQRRAWNEYDIYTGDYTYFFRSARLRSKPKYTLPGVPASVPYDYILYVIPESASSTDLDNTGWVLNTMNEVEAKTAQTAAAIIGPLLGDYSTCPLELSPAMGCPVTPGDPAVDEYYLLDEVGWLVKWHFTWQN